MFQRQRKMEQLKRLTFQSMVHTLFQSKATERCVNNMSEVPIPKRSEVRKPRKNK
jgi:hypothetical protein